MTSAPSGHREAAATRILVVWCPEWPITAARVKPDEVVAVVEANQVVVAVSDAARAEGIHAGLRRREAQSRCPDLVVLARDPDMEARAFEAVVVAIESLCPGVELGRPGVCSLATRGPARYFGGEEALVERVDEVLRSAAGRAQDKSWWRVGIADGSFAAGLAARQGMIVAPGGSASFLAPQPVVALGRPELADLLARLGVRTLGQLAALPLSDVAARFGSDGARAHRLARGGDERRLVARSSGPTLEVRAELDPPAETADRVVWVARSLGQELQERLSTLGLGCARLRVTLETEHGEARSRLWSNDLLGPAVSSMTPESMAERVRWQLQGWRDEVAGSPGFGPGSGPGSGPPTSGVSLVWLSAEEAFADDGRQLPLWGSSEIEGRVTRALVRVQEMLGTGAVAVAAIDGGRGPADWVDLAPWGQARRRSPRLPPWPGRVPAPAPAIVHPEPLAIEVVDAKGRLVEVSGRGMPSAPPSRLSVGGGPWAMVAAWAGPWPADERWWDPSDHRRRARLQVLLDDGRAHLASLESGHWWLEATYD